MSHKDYLISLLGEVNNEKQNGNKRYRIGQIRYQLASLDLLTDIHDLLVDIRRHVAKGDKSIEATVEKLKNELVSKDYLINDLQEEILVLKSRPPLDEVSKRSVNEVSTNRRQRDIFGNESSDRYVREVGGETWGATDLPETEGGTIFVIPSWADKLSLRAQNAFDEITTSVGSALEILNDRIERKVPIVETTQDVVMFHLNLAYKACMKADEDIKSMFDEVSEGEVHD